MEFFFCETCGKRITDDDLELGLGKNKKLKGVYCKECATGVMTMEFAALTGVELRGRLAARETGITINAAKQRETGAVAIIGSR